MRPLKVHSERIWTVAISPIDSTFWTGSEDDSAIHWDAATNKQLNKIAGGGIEITSAALSSDGNQLAFGYEDYTASITDLEGTVILNLVGHLDKINDVVFSADGQYVLTGSDDGTAVLWDRNNGEAIQIFENESYIRINAVAISHTSPVIYTGSDDGDIIEWDYDGSMQRVFTGHEGPVYDIALSPDGTMLVSGSEDATARIWILEEEDDYVSLEGHTDAVQSVAFSPEGNTVVTGGLDGIANTWKLNGEMFKRISRA